MKTTTKPGPVVRWEKNKNRGSDVVRCDNCGNAIAHLANYFATELDRKAK